MIARSLRWRLLLGAAAAILAALVVAWFFMTLLFERHLERRLQAEITRDALGLVVPDGCSPVSAPASPANTRATAASACSPRLASPAWVAANRRARRSRPRRKAATAAGEGRGGAGGSCGRECTPHLSRADRSGPGQRRLDSPGIRGSASCGAGCG